MKRTRLISALAGAALATAVAGGLGWAAIPGPSGVIQGCYDSGGNVKVVEALPCPKGYTPLAWSQAGQQGPKGDKGDAGAEGDPGNLALAGRSCPSGGVVTGFDASGDLVCAPPANGGGGGEPGELRVEPLQLVFPPTPVGMVADLQFVTLTNATAASVSVTTLLVGANATDFELNACETVPAAGTCQLLVRFAPTDPGPRAATVLVQLPNGELVAVELSGTGV